MVARRTVAKVLHFRATLQNRTGVAAARGRPVEYGPPFMLRGRRSRAARFGGLAAVLALTAASAALAAPGRRGAAEGRRHAAAHSSTPGPPGVAEPVRARLATPGLAGPNRVARADRDRPATAAARRSQAGAPRRPEPSLKSRPAQLAVDLRALYERGNVDPVAVVLGAKSLSTGLGRLDALSRVADQGRQIVAATAAAQHRLLLSQGRLTAEERRLERSLAAARQAEQRL